MDDRESEPSRGWLPLVLIMSIGGLMALLDSSIVAVAISTIMNAFNTDEGTVQWVSTAYLLALGIATPLSGWLGDRLGLKALYLGSQAIFVSGSLLCSLSWDIDVLVFARVVQGLGAGLSMPTAMAMIYRVVPRKEIGSAMGIFGIASFIGPALGPTVGGLIIERASWQWIFTINLPAGAAVLALASFFVPESRAKDPGKLDLAGAASSTVMLFCFLFALSKGEDWGWGDERIVLLLLAAFFAFALFVAVELTVEKPLLELRVFKYRSFALGNAVLVVSMVGLYVGTFYFPLYLQKVLGLGAMDTGLRMTPAALISAALMPLTGKLYDKVGARPLILFGLSTLAALTFQFRTLDLTTATATVTLWITLRGAVSPFTNIPAQNAAMADIPTELISRASALTNVVARIASSFGLTVFTSMLTTRQAFHEARYAWTLGAQDLASRSALGSLASAFGGGDRGMSAALAWLHAAAAKLAFVASIDDVFYAAGIFTVAGLVPALLLKKKAPEPPPAEAGT